MKAVRLIGYILMVVAALNWGLIGFFNFNLISAIFGPDVLTAPMGVDPSIATKLIYCLMGIAGILGLGCLCRCCNSTKCKCGPKCDCCKK